MRLKTNKNKGFTLVELLVVIAIIALVSSIVTYFIATARASARDARRVADVKQIASGLELFNNECGGYPALPPATFGITITSSKALYTGTASNCGVSDATYGANGILPKGGIGSTHSASSGETLFIATLPSAPTPIDDGNLTTGNKCSETNSQTSAKWGEYSYVSFAPGDSSHYWIYFCIGRDTGKLTAGRYIMTERGVVPYTGNLFP